ncbi:hypothetical protein SAMN06295910_1911 [Allosphingosinicella indica]|uniref:Uncharacterized protein n=2 Tax=Allosphingosinicella indica TaxID=941907 RepID=A0A1X7GJ49_9SPHN|nr:hypothetical protein SAMN06295910_1911 [Allosphingosinicella indica]
MADVATLIGRLELLRDGEPLPGDNDHIPVFGTKAVIRYNEAHIRFSALAGYYHRDVQRICPRLASELADNLETILTALRFWQSRHD